ncbi:MAG: DUF2306 domain-containing protein [Gammaproteobacteria bacterium]|nr:DUF2306 domain-containing protein [Gammaproteobacteria bacterium]
MIYQQLSYFHLATVIPAFVLGAWLLFSRKGTPIHQLIGKVYMTLMVITAVLTLFMSARVGPTLLDHFGFIHLLSLLVLVEVPRAIFAVRKGQIGTHRQAMVGVYVGGILIAGGFAFMPGRLLSPF